MWSVGDGVWGEREDRWVQLGAGLNRRSWGGEHPHIRCGEAVGSEIVWEGVKAAGGRAEPSFLGRERTPQFAGSGERGGEWAGRAFGE